jgi:hypothetical protein
VVGLNASREIREFQLDVTAFGISGTMDCPDLIDNNTCRIENGKLSLHLQPVSGSIFRISS